MMTIQKNEEVIIMVDFEQVQKLRERANISYEEAKKALEEANGDMLEAVINLEKQNRIKAPETGGYYNSQGENPRANEDCCGRKSWEKKNAHRSEEHTSELQSRPHLVCRLLLEKKKHNKPKQNNI